MDLSDRWYRVKGREKEKKMFTHRKLASCRSCFLKCHTYTQTYIEDELDGPLSFLTL